MLEKTFKICASFGNFLILLIKIAFFGAFAILCSVISSANTKK